MLSLSSGLIWFHGIVVSSLISVLMWCHGIVVSDLNHLISRHPLMSMDIDHVRFNCLYLRHSSVSMVIDHI